MVTVYDMVPDYDWFSPTRMVGLMAYGSSLVACVARRMSCRRSGAQCQSFTILAVIQCFLLLDMAFDWRWRLHDFWDRNAMDLGLYSERRLPQILALAVLIAAATFASIAIARRFRHRVGVAIAATGTMLSVGIWCCEAISYHYVDSVLYSMIGNVMVVSLVWVGLTLVTCFGVWFDRAGQLRR